MSIYLVLQSVLDYFLLLLLVWALLPKKLTKIKMLILGLLLSCICLIKGEFLVPTHELNETVKWADVVSQDISCPILHKYNPSRRDTVVMGVRLPKMVTESLVHGVFCQKIAVSVTCDTDFVGSNTITYSTIPHKTYLRECQHHEIGVPIETPPVPSCSWMKVKTVEKIIMVLLEMTAHYDMYTRTFSGPKFDNCVNPPCYINEDKGVWYPNEEFSDNCDLTPTDSWLDKDDKNLLHGSLFPPKDLKTACKMEFCGVKGYKFTDLEWLYFDDINYIQRLNYAVDCVNKTLKTNHDLYHDRILTEELRDSVREERCIQTLINLSSDRELSRFGLASLVRTTPGAGWAYRMKGKVLQRAYVLYQLAFALTDTLDADVIAYTSSGVPLFWRDWTKSDIPDTLDGPNGITYTQGKVQLPENLYMKISDNEHLINPIEVKHPWEVDKAFNGDHMDLDDVVTKVKKNWMDYLYLIPAMVFILLGWKLFNCLNLKCTCCSRSRRVPPGVELRYLNQDYFSDYKPKI